VLLDIGLPDTTGPEVARRLLEAGGRSAVILISTRDVEDGRRMAAGVAAGYLPKEDLSLRAILDLTGTTPV
jgi:DNA-binding NarL/FixJ family response regulator